MRSIVIILLAFVCCSLVRANDVNISTVTKDGNTFFYLQAGAYNLEKDAKIRQNELAKLVDQKVEIKNLADKHLYLVQIGQLMITKLQEHSKKSYLKKQKNSLIKLAKIKPLHLR